MSAQTLKFSWPDRTSLSRNAFRIVRVLNEKGFTAYIAGGAVRDALLKRPIREIDIATSALPASVEKIFKKTIPTGKKHGTITVREEGVNYEVTTFRVEGAYRNYRYPIQVKFVGSAEKDAKRRDFTVNALFYDSKRKEVLDYVEGISGLSHRRIIFIGDPKKRIREDALRMLRAVRLAAVLEFELARETRKAIQENANLIQKISAERIKQELDRILLSPRPSVGLGLLDVVDLLAYVLPEIKNLQGVVQPKNQHSEGDVYAHSLLAIEKFDQTAELAVRYAILFHDLGKPQTRQIRGGKITFYGHQNIGVDLARKLCQRLKFSAHETEKICWLVKHHMVPHDFVKMKLATRRKWGLHPYFRDLLQVYRADVQASLPPSGKPNLNPTGYREGLRIMEEIKKQPALRKPLLSGTDVMKALHLKPGPLVGRVLAVIEQKKLTNELKSRPAALAFLRANKIYLQKL